MATISDGVKIRAKIDAETVKGLLQINGGGAVALLVFLPTILNRPEYAPLTVAIVYALLSFQFGLLFAIVHNLLRRKCSLAYEQSWQEEKQPAKCKYSIGWLGLDESCICNLSIVFTWLSIVAFIVAGWLVVRGAFEVYGKAEIPSVNTLQRADQTPRCWRVQELKSNIYRVNECTGVVENLNLVPLNPKPPKRPLRQKP